MNTVKLSNFGIVFLRLLLILLLVGLLSFVQPAETLACSCLQPGSPSEALEESTAVFVGEVVSISHTERSDGSYTGYTFVEFNVTTVWKGSVGKTIQIGTADSGPACGYGFSVGLQYLVYSYYGLHTGICSRTSELSEAEIDLAELGEGRNPTTAIPTVMLVLPTATAAPSVTPIPPTATATPSVTPIPPTGTATPTVTPIPPTPTPTPEASENEAVWGCRQSPGSADLPIVGLMVGIAWFGLRKRRPDGR